MAITTQQKTAQPTTTESKPAEQTNTDEKKPDQPATDTTTSDANKTDSTKTDNSQTKPQPTVQQFTELARTHIEPGTPHDPYNSNPPTSGPHFPQPYNWGIYDGTLQDEQAIHNLEHGGIWISYKNIDSATKSKLEAIAKANPGCVILSPRAADDSKIVLASWTRLEKFDSYDESKILDYIKTYKNQSPEPLAQ